MSQTLQASATGASEIAERAELEARQQALHQILDRTAVDPAFRARAIETPAGVLAEYGITMPEGASVRFVERTTDLLLVLPEALDDIVELSEDDLLGVNGGAAQGSAWLSAKTGTSTTVASVVVTAVVTASITVSVMTIIDK